MTFKFKSAFANTQAALKSSPEKGVAVFSTQSRVGDGVNSTVKIRQFIVNVDEPTALGGTDTAPNPVEYILAALGSCQEITYRLYADALGIPVNSISVSLDGALDLRGLFNSSEGVRAGFQKISGSVTIDSPAPEAQLLRLKQIVDAHCPVLDILQNPTPVALTLKHGAH